jgi:hypothetical protein
MQLASDNFQRADANPIGGNWTTGGGASNPQQLASHLVEATVNNATYCMSFWNPIVWPNDQYSEVTLFNLGGPGTNYIGAAVRMSSSAQTVYMGLVESGTQNLYIQKNVAGVVSNPAGPLATTVNVGDVFRLSAVGTLVTFYQNGVQMLQATDASIASGSAGMMHFNAATGTFTSSQISAWAGGNTLPSSFRTLTGVGV